MIPNLWITNPRDVNPLTPNDLQRRRAVNPLKIKIPSQNMRKNNKCNNY
jgi:hypothetical protein